MSKPMNIVGLSYTVLCNRNKHEYKIKTNNINGFNDGCPCPITK